MWETKSWKSCSVPKSVVLYLATYHHPMRTFFCVSNNARFDLRHAQESLSKLFLYFYTYSCRTRVCGAMFWSWSPRGRDRDRNRQGALRPLLQVPGRERAAIWGNQEKGKGCTSRVLCLLFMLRAVWMQAKKGLARDAGAWYHDNFSRSVSHSPSVGMVTLQDPAVAALEISHAFATMTRSGSSMS